MEKYTVKKQGIFVTDDDRDSLGVFDAYVLSMLNDRMKSSRARGDMFKDDDGFYVIFTIEELMETIKCSKGTITKIMKHLKETGNIVSKRMGFNKANRIYLPNFLNTYTQGSLKTELHEVQKMNPNQSNLNQINKHSDTSHTEKLEKIKVAQKENDCELSEADQVNNWTKSLIDVAKVSKATANAVVSYVKSKGTYDVKQCQEIMGTVFKVKYGIIHAKDNNLVADSPITKFESNSDLRDGLTATLSRVFERLTRAKGVIKNELGYLSNALKNFFLDAMGVKDDIKPNSFSNSTTTTKNKPTWMDEPYDPEADKISDKAKAEVKRLLDNFEKGREDYAAI